MIEKAFALLLHMHKSVLRNLFNGVVPISRDFVRVMYVLDPISERN
jgi:hypothetical protein